MSRESVGNVLLACGVLLWIAGSAALDHLFQAITGQPFARYIDYMWPLIVPYAFGFMAVYPLAERVSDGLMYRTNAAEWLGKSFRFVGDGNAAGIPSLTAHSGQIVIVRRIVSSKWRPITMVEVEASDGWRGNVFLDELTDGERSGAASPVAGSI